jgi:pimeloyl-ACP methyl ester carboxylesterase
MRSRAFVVAGCVAGLVACGPPIGVKHLGLRAANEELGANVINAGRPSTASRIELQKRGLAERYAADPADVLSFLHAKLLAGPRDADLLCALAELSFDHALHGGGQPYYLAAVVYAYDYLFGAGAGERLDALDPRGRLVANVYNVGLARGFAVKDSEQIILQAGPRPLPFGTLDVSIAPDTLVWGDRRLFDFTSASELGVHGLRNRYRTWGLGAPLNASTKPLDPAGKTRDFVLPRMRVPVTMLLLPVVEGGTLSSGHLAARIALYAVSKQRTVELGGRAVPLEYEPTSALAESLGRSDVWSTELGGFLAGDLVRQRLPDRLGGLEPVRLDKIPVVFVHGTASSPARWAEMVNDLSNDADMRQHFQYWVFAYDTGNPILYSAMLLREALKTVVRDLDPAGRSTCLRQMVLIGHSQGGLLVKLMVVDSGDHFWRNVSDEPFDQVDLSPRNRDLLGRATFFTPLPFVTEVVFISTPHRGSYRAGGFVRNVLQRMVNFPSDVARAGTDLLTGDDAGRVARQMNRMPTSVDNMAPGSLFVQALSELPIAPDVSAHSIIPVLGDGPLVDEKDGVVAYTSAHIAPVDSELVVRGAGHSVQDDPRAIEEVRRILLEHAASVFDGDVCRPPAAVAQ